MDSHQSMTLTLFVVLCDEEVKSVREAIRPCCLLPSLPETRRLALARINKPRKRAFHLVLHNIAMRSEIGRPDMSDDMQ